MKPQENHGAPSGAVTARADCPGRQREESPMTTRTFKFEATCGTCNGRITSKDSGATWRHDKAPAEKHHGHATGVMREI